MGYRTLFGTAALALATFGASQSSQAAQAIQAVQAVQAVRAAPYMIDLTFLSGATFNGVLDLSSDLSKVEGATGTLDYAVTTGFGPGAITAERIKSVGVVQSNLDLLGADTVVLTDSAKDERIDLAYTYGGGRPTLISSTLVAVNGLGLPTSVSLEQGGSLSAISAGPSPVAAVPEASDYLFMLAGLGALGGYAMYRRRCGGADAVVATA